MIVQMSFDTGKKDELEALKAAVDALSGWQPVGIKYEIDHGSGPLKAVEPAKVTVWTSTGNEELAKAQVNVSENVESVKVKTVPKKKPKASAREMVEAVLNIKPSEPKTEPVEAKVDVETATTEVTDAKIEEALSALDPPAPPKAEVDKTDIRKIMVEFVKQHGPQGAKMASQVVHQIAGCKDVTKIPEDKIDAVKDGLRAAMEGSKADAQDVEEPQAEPTNDEVDC